MERGDFGETQVCRLTLCAWDVVRKDGLYGASFEMVKQTD